MITYTVNCVAYGSRQAYGISAYENNTQIKSVPEISDCIEDINELVRLCNDEEIELCHMEDIIEDFLTDFTV